MRGEPPDNLVGLLARLKLASAAQVRAAAPRVRRLAGELPDFESVWVDALQQARLLTPLQATQINAGRGESLLCGPYVISHRLAAPHYAECFAARHIDTLRTVRLYCVRRPQVPPATAAREIARLAEQLAPLRGPVASVVEDAGIAAEGVWAACPAVEGTTAADWMAENGRFPPSVALHVAREMLARLADLELLGGVHGDVGAAGLVIQSSGHVLLPMPGLRGIVRPHEGYSFNDLPSEAYDYLAPERIAEGGPPTIAGDLYACGCLWWHLLAGRPPLAGGNSLGKLKAAHAAAVIDVRQLAPEIPDVLARAIETCLARDPVARPASSGQLLDLLGPPARGGHAILSRCLAGQPWLWQSARRSPAARRAKRRKRVLIAASALAITCVSIAGTWLARQGGDATGLPAVAAASSAVKSTPKVETPRQSPVAAAGLARNASLASASGWSTPGNAHADQNVKPAVAVEPVASDLPDDMVLPDDQKLRSSELSFKPGQRVRGRAGKRPLLSVSGAGLRVACDDVCFDGIDFVWEGPSIDKGQPNHTRPMLSVAANAIQLRGCSFSCGSDTGPIAIAWTGITDPLPGIDGELTLSDCVFQGMAAVVNCRGNHGLAVEMANTLCVASGPIVLLNDCPRAGKTFAISLDHTTTRGDSAVLECRYGRLEAELGQIVITVADSALVTNPRGALLIFAGSQRPDPLLRAISWSGQGSLVTPATAVGVWRSRADTEQALSEDEIDVGGLVRSEVEFAGRADGPPAASRITRWQVPLRSADPPGANPDSLFLPKP